MNVNQVNEALSLGALETQGLFPHLEELATLAYVFDFEFGLEQQVRTAVAGLGPGTAFYLNGDAIPDAEGLYAQVAGLLPPYRPSAGVRRLFVDEITAVPGWERALKRLADEGLLRKILVVTTGSKALDLRRGRCGRFGFDVPGDGGFPGGLRRDRPGWLGSRVCS
ncbi:MAG: AAA family ATPase [Spirochaetales bacterium]|nr:AAA family ATPase [Spirochaetales bacterium]